MSSRLFIQCIFNLSVCYFSLFAVGPEEPAMDTFAGKWIYSSETSVLIYWHMDSLKKEAISYVEYGETSSYGQKTPATQTARWAHFHRITGLDTNKTYHFRMVMIQSNGEIRSNDSTFVTANNVSAIHLPLDGQTPPCKPYHLLPIVY